MNKHGSAYIQSVEKTYNQVVGTTKARFVCPRWTDDIFQERLLRMGVEFKAFEMDMFDTSSVEKIVIASLKSDFNRRHGK